MPLRLVISIGIDGLVLTEGNPYMLESELALAGIITW